MALLRPEVLGIGNRTENWKTAYHLAPFFEDRAICLARKLGETEAKRPDEVTLELYWKGARDWLAGSENKQEREERKRLLLESYRRLMEKLDLRNRMKRYDDFRNLHDRNYEIPPEGYELRSRGSKASPKGPAERLLDNLVNTEIDIVLESPGHLYIGEAKSESGFHASAKLVLVHQLVRQYVMAKTLVDVTGCGKKVVPFVVTKESWQNRECDGNCEKPPGRPTQVHFMIKQCWMKAKNCLAWRDLKQMVPE